MNCTQVRERLLVWQYGELPAAEGAEVEGHLATCAACREELSAWQSFRRRLEAFQGPAVHVDLPRVYQLAVQRHERRVRRWRRTALAVCAAAAVVLIAVGLKLEIRVEASQVVFRWGGPSPVAPQFQEPAPPVVQIQPPLPPVTAEEVLLAKNLVRALAKEVETRDRQQQEALLRLQGRFETFLALLGRTNDRSASNERDVDALYAALFRISKKGENR